MVRPSKRARLAIEVVLVADDDEDQEAGEDRGHIHIEDVNVQMYGVSSGDSDSDEVANNNYIDQDQEEEPVEEAGQLDDTKVSQADPANEEDDDEDEGFELHPCDWCKENVRHLVMVDEEDICERCVRESDLERNENGEWGYPKRQFEDSENAEDDGSGSDTSVIVLSDSDDEGEAVEPEADAVEPEA